MRFLLLLLLTTQLHAQTTQLAGIINHYAAVTAMDTCSGAITVSDTTGFRAGGAILILQVQGAQISTANNSMYGQVQNLRSAGHYERAIVDSVSATAIFLKNHWLRTYELSGRVQVITFPQYASAVVVDTLRARAWNGTTGGVLALEVSDTLFLNAPLWAEGAGFRGGAPNFVASNNCNFAIPEAGYFYALGNWRSSPKGEGIAAIETGKELGRGPQANGGGGGNDHNAGGGGGGNVFAGGQGADNNEPSTFGCDGHFPGLGGRSNLGGENNLFFGGGGGAGHANNGPTNAGANGGGLVIVQAKAIFGTNPLISVNGQSAKTADGDGGGGGGGGGIIRVQAETVTAALRLSVKGGNGGNTTNINANRCAGPGGGGGAGYILTNVVALTSVGAGQPGIITNSSNGCNGSHGGADTGEAGAVIPLSSFPEGIMSVGLPVITLAPQPATVCTGMDAWLFVSTNTGSWNYQWQILDGGVWQNLPNGPTYNGVQSDSLHILDVTGSQNGLHYRVVIQSGNCAQIISDEALLTVSATPIAGFIPTVNGLTVSFDNQSTQATAYFWDFGDNNFSTSADPQHTYVQAGVYTVTLLAISACDTATFSQPVSLLLAPTANFAVADSTLGCLSATVAFENLSSVNVDSYQWSFPGGNPGTSTMENPVISYSNSGTYTATLIAANAAGQDTLSRTFQIEVATFPVADFDYTLQPGGLVNFVNQGQGGMHFSWDFGDGSVLDTNMNVSYQYAQSGTYVVTLSVSNPCGGAILQQNVVVVADGTGTSTAQHLGRVRLFPNPASDRLTVNCSAADALPTAIEVFDTDGRLVFTKRHDFQPVMNLSISDWPTGTYTIVLYFEQGWVVRGVVHTNE